MKVILAQPRGFCAGVVRAIEIVERALVKYGPPVYVRHEIVHNKHVVESLKAKGAVFVEEGAIGGFAAHVMQTLATHGALDHGLKVRCMLLPNVFIDQDSPAAMYAVAGLDAKGIVAKVFEALGKDVRIDVVQHA